MASAWPSPRCYEHLGSELTDGREVSLCLPSLSLSLSFKKKSKKKKEHNPPEGGEAQAAAEEPRDPQAVGSLAHLGPSVCSGCSNKYTNLAGLKTRAHSPSQARRADVQGRLAGRHSSWT